MCEDNMLFSRVKISCFCAKVYLVSHWCLYNKSALLSKVRHLFQTFLTTLILVVAWFLLMPLIRQEAVGLLLLPTGIR